MVGATADTTSTSTSMTTEMTKNTSPHVAEIGCQICSEHFMSREAQREHMKEDWHVFNIRRKMASQPPVSRSAYETRPHTINIKKGKAKVNSEPGSWEAGNLHSGSGSGEDEDEDEDVISTECLFCSTSLDSTNRILAHMSLSHDFVIPDLDHLLDIDSFLGYLSTIVGTFHECLFCGSVEDSKEELQHHMRGMKHCALELERDALELKDFWDQEEDEEGEEGWDLVDDEANSGNGIIRVESELRLQSGKILGRRTKTPKARMEICSSSSKIRSRSSSPPQQHLNEYTQPQGQSSSSSSTTQSTSLLPPSQTLTRQTPRNERRTVPKPGTSTSLIGLSNIQLRALRATEMRIEKVETKAKKMYEAKVDRKGNKQKTFRVLSIGKKAGGLEKRNG